MMGEENVGSPRSPGGHRWTAEQVWFGDHVKSEFG